MDRVRCPVCGRDRVSLRANGQMRFHGPLPTDNQQTRRYQRYRVPPKGCDGTGLTLIDAERWVKES